jgi:hypothetical protein
MVGADHDGAAPRFSDVALQAELDRTLMKGSRDLLMNALWSTSEIDARRFAGTDVRRFTGTDVRRFLATDGRRFMGTDARRFWVTGVRGFSEGTAL